MKPKELDFEITFPIVKKVDFNVSIPAVYVVGKTGDRGWQGWQGEDGYIGKDGNRGYQGIDGTPGWLRITTIDNPEGVLLGEQFTISQNNELVLNEPPIYIQPTLELAVEPIDNIVESGTQLTLNITSKFKQNDAGEITNSTIYFNGLKINVGDSLELFYDSTIEEGENELLNIVTYSDGIIKTNSAGVLDMTGYIVADEIKDTKIILGARKAFATALPNNVGITNINIRNFSQQYLNPLPGQEFVINVPEGSKFIALAIPQGIGQLSQIIQQSLELNIFSAFDMQMVNVSGANNYSSIPYEVYILQSLVELPADIYRWGLT